MAELHPDIESVILSEDDICLYTHLTLPTILLV